MASTVPMKTIAIAALFVVLSYVVGPPVQRTLTVFGYWRQPVPTPLADEDLVVIDDTTNCEDLHFHAASNTLFTACEDHLETRFAWFPPLSLFDDPAIVAKNRGSIHTIDPKTFKSTRLAFTNFDDPFVTHGIDVVSDPDRPDGEAVYVFAVNHLPNPDFLWDGAAAAAATAGVPKARSRIEVFHHVVGTKMAQHVRSIAHPLIRTPNDIAAVSHDAFYVTNDHYYRGGALRQVEDIVAAARWTDVVHVRIKNSTSRTATEGFDISVALPNVHNSNGISRGRSADEIVVSSCTSGVLNICQRSASRLKIVHSSVKADFVIDNPNYFADPYAGDGGDFSGFVLPGLSHAIDLGKTHTDPLASESIMVALARPLPGGEGAGQWETANTTDKWETRLLFEDDGSRIRSVSAAVLVAIDPRHEGGARKAWAFVTGFLSKNAIAVKINL
ncbi:hypothetical protein SBRCBS47491_010152 [Sporothrix bragantina]|uniref:Serum paraoxonase/arylesterase family protein n=1 Tax=Sporothrix bragantina TaxID=671064 RepID=A0ABP0D3F9_9PEZI